MMKYYVIRRVLLKDGIELDAKYGGCLLQEESETKNTNFTIGWNDLEFYLHQFDFPYEVLDTKRGKKIVFPPCSPSIKQWKEPNLKLTIKCEYIESSISIKQILKYPNADAAIQYLKERGLSVAVGR